jgi:S1-C subfamily serine protease
MRNLTIQATKLADSKKAVPMADLAKQLNRTKCKLSLPARLTRRLARPEIYSRNVSSVLIVAGLHKCNKCVKWHASPASGFALTSTGAIATNYHLFENKEKKALVAMTHDGKTYGVKEVLAASRSDDIVILQLDMGGAKLKPLPLAPDTPIGTEVTAISHPQHRFYSLTEGVISRYSKRRTKRGRTNMVAITADFAKGSSGGPIFDDRGNVAAMVASTSSVYYTQTKNTQKNLQMVFKQCVPTANILKLITNAPTGRR